MSEKEIYVHIYENDLEKELCRFHDDLLDWFAEEILIQPNSKFREMSEALNMIELIKKVNLK